MGKVINAIYLKKIKRIKNKNLNNTKHTSMVFSIYKLSRFKITKSIR